MVGNILQRLFLSSKSHEQKKVAPSLPSAKLISANVWAMIDFPVLARPLSHNTCLSCLSFNQDSSWERTSLLVPFMHLCLSPQRYLMSTTGDMQSRHVRAALSCHLVTTCARVIRGETHNELAALIIQVLLQGCLIQMSGKLGARNLRTNLIIHHGVTDVLDQATKLIHITGAV